MSEPWWGKETQATGVTRDRRRLVDGPFGKRPQLHSESPRDVITELRARRPHFTPEWDDPPDVDAGGALADLFAAQFASVVQRLNRLPDKSLVDFLDLAGIRTATARPATALVQFEVSRAAREPVLVSKGFQVGAQPADDSSDLVVWETQATHFMAPANIAMLITDQAGAQRDHSAENDDVEQSFAPLGDRPQVDDALLIGLQAADNAILRNTLSLGIRIAAAPGNPPPVSDGGGAPLPLPASPVLRWEARVGAAFQPVEVARDETSNLWRSGIVTLRLPPDFRAQQVVGDEKLFWLRLRLIHGRFEQPPRLSFIRLNMARVEAVQTVRNEVLEPVDELPSNRMTVRNTPVVPGSMIIEVDESALSGSQASGQPSVTRWDEVDDLSLHGPTDEVFTVDPESGIVTFGDGRNGATVPPGFRNVRAAEYKVGSGAAGGVERDRITTLLNSAPFVTGVSNPLPTSGGVDRESQRDAIRRGPETIRAGHRSVTVADYAVMAPFAPGADVRRAHAVSGCHPLFPAAHLAGVVGVLVVPPAEEAGPPVPDEQALRAVTRYLSSTVAPAGVEVVAAAPSYREVRGEVGFVPDRTGDPGEIGRSISADLTTYLHPLTGGNDGEGWPFGGTLRFSELVQRLLKRVPGVQSVPRLRLIVDGVPQRRCADVAIRPTELFWPLDHQVLPLESEDAR